MTWELLLSWIVVVAVAVVVAAVVFAAVEVAARIVRRGWPDLWRHWQQVRRPVAGSMLAVSLYVALNNGIDAEAAGRGVVLHIVLICMIGALVWLLASLVLALLRLSKKRILARKENDRDRRRSQTQLRLVERLIMAAFVILAVAMILLTFPGVDRIGAGILASAGLLSVAAGLAAQSSLANVFAGIQLAFSDAIRIGDIVVVEDEYGRIEDITLTYVVLRIWDDRRLVLPSTYFTTTPFTNWTRTGTELIGTIYFELDWQVDVAGMRERLAELVAGSELWDGRSSSLVVTDATGSMLTVRAVVSATDADKLWGLQCMVREELAGWVRDTNPEGLPQQRVTLDRPARNPGPDQ